MVTTVNNISKREIELVHSIHLVERIKGSNSPDFVNLLNELGSFFEGRHEFSQAERIYRRSYKIMSNIESEERNIQRLRIRTICNLGRLLSAQGRYNKAEKAFFRALIIAARIFGSEHIEFARVLKYLGNLYEDMGYLDEAKPIHQKAFSIFGALNCVEAQSA